MPMDRPFTTMDILTSLEALDPGRVRAQASAADQHIFDLGGERGIVRRMRRAMEHRACSGGKVSGMAAEKCLKTCDRVLYADGNLTGRDNLRALCSALLPKAPKS